MLRFLTMLIFATAIFATLNGRSMAEAAVITADASMAVVSASDLRPHSVACDDCPECPKSDKPCCPMSACFCPAACSTTLAPLPNSLPANAFEHSSAGMWPEEADPGSVIPGLDPPVPRRST
ncbi:MAG: hypothetical protein B7Y12_02410 [Rhizobiales bacterium 24-66-13]|nr:MAG: hypothetical protein B7Y12_02410 [Rhizobiales bacterium 24-66-13]OZB11755.1 MAG: hypothetical protein B7X67_02255 [Rhizobiales bacterium 39-66-18]